MAKVNIKGPIISDDDQWIYDWFGIEATSPKKVHKEMAAAVNNEDLEVNINSGGGDVFAGSEIFTALKDYPGNVTGKIVGLAGSIASVIAMGCDKLLMSPTAQMMIHNASGRTQGDYRDMEHTAGILKNVNETIANAYMLKSGMDQKTLLKMMDAETWLTPQQALENNLIDEIMFNDQVKLVASIGNLPTLPQEVINKIRAMKEKFISTNSDEGADGIRNMESSSCVCQSCNHGDNCQSSGAKCCICCNCPDVGQCTQPGAEGCQCKDCTLATNNACQPGEEKCLCSDCSNQDTCGRGQMDGMENKTQHGTKRTNNSESAFLVQQAQAKLNLLKMKGGN